MRLFVVLTLFSNDQSHRRSVHPAGLVDVGDRQGDSFTNGTTEHRAFAAQRDEEAEREQAVVGDFNRGRRRRGTQIGHFDGRIRRAGGKQADEREQRQWPDCVAT